jgi:hypothetical protein
MSGNRSRHVQAVRGRGRARKQGMNGNRLVSLHQQGLDHLRCTTNWHPTSAGKEAERLGTHADGNAD